MCQLCDAGKDEVDFDLWRQMTVEHLIGQGQGGYLQQISEALAHRFPGLTGTERGDLARRIDEVNTITARSFCNSTTSRNRALIGMAEAIGSAPDGSPEAIFEHVTVDLDAIWSAKRRDVAWKLDAVRKAFDIGVSPGLTQRRATSGVGASGDPVDDVATLVEAIADVADVSDFVSPPGYAHISLGLVDAVYSIRMRYPAVRKVVIGYGEASGTPDEPLSARDAPNFGERGLDHLLGVAGAWQGQELADGLFGGSRSRTRGRLKADVCVEVARRLVDAGVTTAADLRARAAQPEVRLAWTGVTGLGWITWQYFCSLNGHDQFKPDVMVVRFVSGAIGRSVTPAETDELLKAACTALQTAHPELTRRAVDHTIWRYQRSLGAH